MSRMGRWAVLFIITAPFYHDILLDDLEFIDEFITSKILQFRKSESHTSWSESLTRCFFKTPYNCSQSFYFNLWLNLDINLKILSQLAKLKLVRIWK